MIIFWVFLLFGVSVAEEFFSLPRPYKIWTDRSLEELLQQEGSGEKSPELYYNIAILYKKRNELISAKSYMQKAILVDGENSFLYGELGKIYLADGKRDSALYYFERSLELNYENLPIWEEIVKIKPEYYFNLGMLYAEKGREKNSPELMGKAITYLNQYESEVPSGQFVEISRTSRNELTLLLKDIESKKRREEYRAREQELARAKAEALRISMREFRETNRICVGLGFGSFNPAFSFLFYAKDTSSVLEDSVVIKQPLSELTIYGGAFWGPVFGRGFIAFGSSATDKTFIEGYNVNLTPPKPIYGSVTELKSFRLGVSGFYNPFFKPPVLLLIGAEADYASYTPVDKNDTFGSSSGFQTGLEIVLMGYLRNFLFELGYIQGMIGGKRGGRINVGVGYKF